MRLLLTVLLAACTASTSPIPTDLPQPPGKDDGGEFAVTGAKSWYLVGNALTPGDDRLELAVTGPADTEIVDLWLDGHHASRQRTDGTGEFRFSVDLTTTPIGDHLVLLAADNAHIAFSAVRFHRSHPLYIAVSNDWDNADNGDPMLERQVRLHANHPHLLVTHFVGPYTFTDPSVSPARRRFLVDWVTGLHDQHGDEIGLHIHPWCNFVTTAGVACRTSPSFAFASGDTTGYTVNLNSYTESELAKLFARATALFEANGLPAPTSFRAGGWTADLAVLRALGNAGHVADSSACNWARIEEWEFHSGASLFQWNQEHWSSIDESSQPYHPSTSDILADAGPHLPILEVPDNGALVDYVSAAEMIDMFGKNFPDGAPLEAPRVYAIGYHPPNFSETFFTRIDTALSEIDRHLAAEDGGPVVYARMSDLDKVF